MEKKQIAAAILALIILALILFFIITRIGDIQAAFFAWWEQIKQSIGVA